MNLKRPISLVMGACLLGLAVLTGFADTAKLTLDTKAIIGMVLVTGALISIGISWEY